MMCSLVANFSFNSTKDDNNKVLIVLVVLFFLLKTDDHGYDIHLKINKKEDSIGSCKNSKDSYKYV